MRIEPFKSMTHKVNSKINKQTNKLANKTYHVRSVPTINSYYPSHILVLFELIFSSGKHIITMRVFFVNLFYNLYLFGMLTEISSP